MTSQEAFSSIIELLASGDCTRVVDQFYDENMFGNFVISFLRHGAKRSVVNDRGEIVICDDFGGGGTCKTILPHLRSVVESDLRAVLLNSL